MTGKFRIVSDGTPRGWRVYGPDGNEVRGVVSVEFRQDTGDVSEMTLRVIGVECDIAVQKVAE